MQTVPPEHSRVPQSNITDTYEPWEDNNEQKGKKVVLSPLSRVRRPVTGTLHA